MTDGIKKIINGVLDREGEAFTNDPNDAGGPTKWGITQKTLSTYFGRPATITEVQNLPRDVAADVYYKQYVTGPGFDKVVTVSELIGDELVDSGVNCGVGQASLWLQRILNALNRQQKDYVDVKEDGQVGSGTVAALVALLQKRSNRYVDGVAYSEGELVVWRYLNALQGSYYIQLAEKYKNDEEFIFGWGLNRLGGRV